HWLLTPCGERFFSVGVNVIDGGEPQRFSDRRIAYHWGTFYPDLEDWARTTRQRVLAWGFNTAGAWSLHPAILALPITPDLELGRSARFHWFDPFDPATAEQMHAWAHLLVAPYKGNPYRIGYFIDNEVGWWNGALFIYFLKQPAANRTKQQLVAQLREHYGNNWERFTQDFVPPQGTDSFDQLLHHTHPTQLRPGGAGIQFVRKWTGIITALYYRLAHDALRAADPDALILGDRLPIYYDPVAVRTMVQYVDVLSTNYNVDSPDGWLARYFFDGLRQLAPGKPILISEWFFAADENRSGNVNNGHLMTVASQAERTRGAVAAAQRFAREPEIVGLHWFQYYDHPWGGREDGEDYNFGLIDINDRPYERLVDAFSRINPRLADLHQQRPETAVRNRPGPWGIPHAAIDAQDRSLREWPKERALITPLTAPKPEIPFGDFYAAWSPTGLHLAMIAMDYYDSDLLAYDGEFPLQEAFRIDWGVDAGGGARRFTLYIVPPRLFPESGAPMMRPRLCVADQVSCQPVPGAVTTYFGSDQPRITVEVTLPWRALGVTAPTSQADLRMEVAATAWHRSRWMSWSGLPPAQAMQDPSQWRPARLAGD
ncbi:MAG TPA: hypothetical protein VHM64_15460, partial [Candidatus Binatia bacterium]|nr:hypothetical protein [Candidatus Binatia bacterium]